MINVNKTYVKSMVELAESFGYYDDLLLAYMEERENGNVAF